MRICCRGNVFTYPLLTNESRDTHIDTQTYGRDLTKYSVETGSGAMIDITKFQ
jgi:hypothetical protein